MSTGTTTAPAIPLPDPPLEDGELSLRRWRPEDAPALVAAWVDADVARWTGVPSRTDDAYARHWIAGDGDRRARGLALDLVIDVDGVVAGEVGLSAFDAAAGTVDIGWWIAPTHRGRGLAARAARLVATWVVSELCVQEAVARCDPANPPSAGVARSAGFSPTDRDDVWVFSPPG